MGANASRCQNQLDTAAAVTLKAKGLITTTTAETAISLSELNKAWWSNFEIPHGKFVVNFNVSAGLFNGDAGWDDETYVATLKVDEVVALNDDVATIDTFTILGRGSYSRVIDSKDIPNLNSTAAHDGGAAQDKFIGVTMTLAGGEPTITYACWISKSLGE
jgi:hypothetical protein